MKWILRRPDIPQKVSDIVAAATGMPKEVLFEDTTAYFINNIPEAVDLFMDHVEANHVVRIHTDYDTDGAGSSWIMRILLDEVVSAKYPDFAEQWDVIVPCRFKDGFGVKPRHMDGYAQEGAKLVITCDNGVASLEAVSRAKELGMDVIILDHHQPAVVDGQEVLPEADVLIDPHVTGGVYEDYCGAGIALAFAKEVLSRLNLSEKDRVDMTDRLTALAALSTIGDVVPLTWDNRRIVSEGLAAFNRKPPTRGFQELMEQKQMNIITSIDVAFGISPIINAAGRLEEKGTAKVVDALGYTGRIKDSVKEAIAECVELNKKRQELTAAGLERAELYLAQTNQIGNKFLISVDPELSIGIAGLVSGKLTEKYKVPSISLASLPEDKTVFKGSGRSPEWASMIDALNANAQYMVAYGGHPGACGLTIAGDQIEEFRKAMMAVIPEPPADYKDDTVFYDMQVRPQDAGALYEAIEYMGPYGQGNPEIQVRVDGVELNDFMPTEEIKHMRLMGANRQHLKLKSRHFDLVWFDGAKPYEEMGLPKKVDVIGTLSLNWFRDNSTLQMQITDLRPAQ